MPHIRIHVWQLHIKLWHQHTWTHCSSPFSLSFSCVSCKLTASSRLKPTWLLNWRLRPPAVPPWAANHFSLSPLTEQRQRASPRLPGQSTLRSGVRNMKRVCLCSVWMTWSLYVNNVQLWAMKGTGFTSWLRLPLTARYDTETMQNIWTALKT